MNSAQAGAVRGQTGENEKWWAILTEARTFFEQREP
jgi:hypothetical protein